MDFQNFGKELLAQTFSDSCDSFVRLVLCNRRRSPSLFQKYESGSRAQMGQVTSKGSQGTFLIGIETSIFQKHVRDLAVGFGGLRHCKQSECFQLTVPRHKRTCHRSCSIIVAPARCSKEDTAVTADTEIKSICKMWIVWIDSVESFRLYRRPLPLATCACCFSHCLIAAPVVHDLSSLKTARKSADHHGAHVQYFEVVNAPLAFRMVFAFMSTLMSKRQVGRVKVSQSGACVAQQKLSKAASTLTCRRRG
eukprot:4070970-Amphidinium_carterae.1